MEWTFNEPDDYYWNHDSFSTKEEAEDAAIEYAKENGFTEMEIGRCEPLPLPCYLDTDDVLESLDEQYANEAGSEYDGDLYEDITEEDVEWLKEELSRVIYEFHERAEVKSNWNTIHDICEIHIPISKLCGTCKYYQYEDMTRGMVCVNGDSEFVTEWTDSDHTCNEWEECFCD